MRYTRCRKEQFGNSSSISFKELKNEGSSYRADNYVHAV
jgi:hypothetical protein